MNTQPSYLMQVLQVTECGDYALMNLKRRNYLQINQRTVFTGRIMFSTKQVITFLQLKNRIEQTATHNTASSSNARSGLISVANTKKKKKNKTRIQQPHMYTHMCLPNDADDETESKKVVAS